MPQPYQSSPEIPPQAQSQTPLSFEHTLKLENEPDKAVPEAIKRELSTPKSTFVVSPIAEMSTIT